MTKFVGFVGFATQVETAPGVWVDQIIERRYRGEILQVLTSWEANETLNDELTIRNRISVLADSYMNTNLGVMKYIYFNGTRWKITSMETKRPRIILSLGGVYNGPTP